MKKLITIILSAYMFVSYAKPVLAGDLVAATSAKLATGNINSKSSFDQKVNTLRAFLQRYDSPLAKYSDKFVSEADKNGVDWRLVVAITGVESTFGKHIPSNSCNAYGWANGNFHFKTWEQSIEVVSQTLKQKYIDKGADTVAKIGRVYAPPSTTWSAKVEYFINKIDPLGLDYTI